MSGTRELLRALFVLTRSSGPSGTLLAVAPRRGSRQVTTIDPNEVERAIGFERAAPAGSSGDRALVIEGADDHGPWSASLKFGERTDLVPGVVELRSGPSELGLLLAGVVLSRELIVSGQLLGDLAPLTTLAYLQEHRSSLASPWSLIEMWAWAEYQGDLCG